MNTQPSFTYENFLSINQTHYDVKVHNVETLSQKSMQWKEKYQNIEMSTRGMKKYGEFNNNTSYMLYMAYERNK